MSSTAFYRCPHGVISGHVLAESDNEARRNIGCGSCQHEGAICKGPRITSAPAPEKPAKGKAGRPRKNPLSPEPVQAVEAVREPVAPLPPEEPEPWFEPVITPPIEHRVRRAEEAEERFIAERETQREGENVPPVSADDDPHDAIRAELIKWANEPKMRNSQFAVARKLLIDFSEELQAARRAGYSWRDITGLFKRNGYVVSEHAMSKQVAAVWGNNWNEGAAK